MYLQQPNFLQLSINGVQIPLENPFNKLMIAQAKAKSGSADWWLAPAKSKEFAA